MLYVFDQVQLRTEVLHTPSLTRPGFELMTSRSWQYISCHWDTWPSVTSRHTWHGMSLLIPDVEKWTQNSNSKPCFSYRFQYAAAGVLPEPGKKMKVNMRDLHKEMEGEVAFLQQLPALGAQSVLFRLYFFIAAQTDQVAQPMLFEWTRQLGQSGQQ